MSTRYPTTLSFWEKVVLIYALFRACKNSPSRVMHHFTEATAVGSGFGALILSPFRGKDGAPTVFTHVKLAIGRAFMRNISIAQSQ